MNEPLAYELEPHHFKKLREISARLNSPKPLDWDDRRDLANLIDLICMQAIRIND